MFYNLLERADGTGSGFGTNCGAGLRLHQSYSVAATRPRLQAFHRDLLPSRSGCSMTNSLLFCGIARTLITVKPAAAAAGSRAVLGQPDNLLFSSHPIDWLSRSLIFQNSNSPLPRTRVIEVKEILAGRCIVRVAGGGAGRGGGSP